MSVYLRAAQLLPAADGTTHLMPPHGGTTIHGCCDAIEAIGASTDAFCDMFKPERSGFSPYWYGHEPSDDEARVLALLFMHWMTVNP